MMSPTGSAPQQQYISQQHQSNMSAHGYGAAQQHATPQHRYQYFGHDPNVNVPSDMCLMGCVFVMVLDDRTADAHTLAEWKLLIELYGGVVDGAYSVRCTHVLTNTIQHTTVRQALKEQKRCVTPQWLNDCLAQKRMCPPWKVAHLPCLYLDNAKPARGKLFTITSAFDTTERECLKQMVHSIGGRFTSYLSSGHNFLIAKSMNDGSKVQRAGEWRVPVVNIRWLTELCVCYAGVLENYAHENYRRFIMTPSNQSVLCLDPSAFETIPGACQMLIIPWRQPISVSQEIWQAANKRRDVLLKESESFNPQRAIKSPSLTDAEVEEKSKTFISENDIKSAVTCRVAFSGFNEAELAHWLQQIRSLCMVLAESVSECTHLVVKDLKRTHHLLEALALGKYVVGFRWIQESCTQLRILEPTDYLIRDDESESFFGYNIRSSVGKARVKRLFQGMVFYVTPSVPPSRAVIVDLINKAGGKALLSRPAGTTIAKYIQDSIPFIVISCDADIALCLTMIECNIVVHSVEFVLTGLLRQQVDLEAYALAQNTTYSGISFVEQ